MRFTRNLKKIGNKKMTEQEFEKFWGEKGPVYRIYVGNFGDYVDTDDVKFDVETQKITMFLKGVKIGVFGTFSFERKNENGQVAK